MIFDTDTISIDKKYSSISLSRTHHESKIHSPKVKFSVLISALLQITIETEDTTDKLKAPMVPKWNF